MSSWNLWIDLLKVEVSRGVNGENLLEDGRKVGTVREMAAQFSNIGVQLLPSE
jgi:hypothetical protein